MLDKFSEDIKTPSPWKEKNSLIDQLMHWRTAFHQTIKVLKR